MYSFTKSANKSSIKSWMEVVIQKTNQNGKDILTQKQK